MSDPRLLLIDSTPIGGVAATGALKAAYFNGWREDALLHIASRSTGRLCVDPRDGNSQVFTPSTEAASKILSHFQPELILYRPVADDPALHAFAKTIIETSDASLVLWFMDDWPARLEAQDREQFELYERDLEQLFKRSDKNFAISDGMAAAFAERYSAEFSVARNGVRPSDWATIRRTRDDSDVLIRYAGSLAPDTTLDSVRHIAETVAELRRQGAPILFEGVTQPHWLDRYGGDFAGLDGVRMRAASMSPEEYRTWLANADIVPIAYNFDEKTARYLQYSFANKAPEALASGAAVLLYGPKTLETIRFLADAGVGVSVTSPGDLAPTLKALAADGARRKRIGEAGRAFAFENFDLVDARRRFIGVLNAIANRTPVNIVADEDDQLQLDECAFVFHLINPQTSGGVLIDVGAHEGAALAPYARSGWRVIAFEPDKTNRETLSLQFGSLPNVDIREQAVGATVEKNVAFYRSSVSSGISGLTPFHDSHRQAGSVDVTTLAAVCAAQSIDAIDVLKIDVEGGELDVVRGLDLRRIRPRVVIAEFDSAKGPHSAPDEIAKPFLELGYTVWFSEWRPITAYGDDHRWRRLIRHPERPAAESWGNIIAFRSPPDAASMAGAFSAALRRGPAGFGAAATADLIAAARQKPSIRQRFSRLIWTHFPSVARKLSALRRRGGLSSAR